MSNNSDNKKLWGGRFTEPTDQMVESFTESVSFDARLYRYDIRGSLAHSKMLGKIGVLTEDEVSAIAAGLNSLLQQIEHRSVPSNGRVHNRNANAKTEVPNPTKTGQTNMNSLKRRQLASMDNFCAQTM